MDFIQILKDSFNLLKRKKYLLVFGLFLSFLSQRASLNSGINTSNTNTARDLENFDGSFLNSFPDTNALITLFILIALCIIAIVIVAYIVKNLSLISIIRSTLNDIYQTEDPKPTKLFTSSKKYLLNKILLDIVLALPIILIIILILGSVFFTFIIFMGSMLGNTEIDSTLFMCLMPLLCLLVPLLIILAVIINFIKQLSTFFIVYMDLGVISSIIEAKNSIRKNLPHYLLAWLIMLVLGMALGSLIFLPATFLLSGLIIGSAFIGAFASLAAALITWIIMVLLNTPVITFQNIYWTRVFWTIENEKKL